MFATLVALSPAMTATRDRDTGTWRFHFQLNGKRYVQRGFATKRKATDAESERRRKLLAGHTDAFKTFSDLVSAYLRESVRTKSREWAEQLAWKLNKACGAWHRLRLEQITPAHVVQALQALETKADGKPRSARSINEYRRIIHGIFQYAVKLRALDYNPVSPVSRVPESEATLPPIPTADLRRLLVAAPPALARQLTVQALTGARWIEMARLTRADLFLDAVPPYCVLRHRKKKGGGERLRRQYLAPPAVTALRAQLAELAGDRIFPGPRDSQKHDAALHWLQRACARAGIGRYGFHAVRRWAATVAMESGQSTRRIATFLGHATTAATERYTWLADPVQVAIGERLVDVLGMAPEEKHTATSTGKEKSP